MSEIEKRELADRVRAMDPDELKVVIRNMPDNLLEQELDRREQIRIRELQKRRQDSYRQRLGIRKALGV